MCLQSYSAWYVSLFSCLMTSHNDVMSFDDPLSSQVTIRTHMKGWRQEDRIRKNMSWVNAFLTDNRKEQNDNLEHPTKNVNVSSRFRDFRFPLRRIRTETRRRRRIQCWVSLQWKINTGQLEAWNTIMWLKGGHLVLREKYLTHEGTSVSRVKK